MRGTPLIAYWGDTRELLSHEERGHYLLTATLEKMTGNEIFLRAFSSNRSIVITTETPAEGLFCTLCKHEMVRERYGKTCPTFAKCALNGKHKGG